MSQRLEERLGQGLVQTLPYERAGDLELLSLHRIKGRIGTLDVDTDVRQLLIQQLLKANADYREETGKKWYCLTPSSLYDAISEAVDTLRERIAPALSTIDDTAVRERLSILFSHRIDEQSTKIRQWFSDSYDSLLYATDGRIPYAVVLAMRGRFSQWALQNANPFDQPIGEFLNDAATNAGLDPAAYDSNEALWKALKERS